MISFHYALVSSGKRIDMFFAFIHELRFPPLTFSLGCCCRLFPSSFPCFLRLTFRRISFILLCWRDSAVLPRPPRNSEQSYQFQFPIEMSSTPPQSVPTTPTPIHRPLPPPLRRYRGPPEAKKKRNCLQIACQPSIIFLLGTIACTALATVLLSYALSGRYWEILTYDMEKVQEIVASNGSNVKFLFNGKVPVISFSPGDETKYLLPLHSGVWISCIDLEESDFKDLQQLGYEKEVQCVDHLDPEIKPKESMAAASWQHRMQNLAIACAMVCLILQGAAVFVGLFGIMRPQISAVLVTGVIYVLSATFCFFTLTIVHFKHKNRTEREPLDVWTRLIPELGSNEFRSARVITHGSDLHLAWAGNSVCVLAAVMWILLSKMMRYNPISFSP